MNVNSHLRARLEGQGDLRVKVSSPLGGHKQGDTGTALPLGMEHPEAAAEVEVEAGLREVLSRQQ